jgi:hypothetical protein
MMIRRGSLVILATLLLSSCSDIQEAIGTPKAEEFTDWFKWFVDFFKPNDLSSNQEVIIFTLLILIVLGACAALMNSTRALNFFNEPPFQNGFLSVLLLSPTFLMFPFRSIKHPGWALGIWVFLRSLYICFLLIFAFVILFYLAVILPYIIVIAIVIVVIVIFGVISESRS